MLSEGVRKMVDKVMAELHSRVDDVLELLHQIDGDTARQMEQEMDRIQKIIDAFRPSDTDLE